MFCFGMLQHLQGLLIASSVHKEEHAALGRLGRMGRGPLCVLHWLFCRRALWKTNECLHGITVSFARVRHKRTLALDAPLSPLLEKIMDHLQMARVRLTSTRRSPS